jgi:hypothetical protein
MMAYLVGTWKLVSAEARREDGQVFHPFGEDAIGLGVFTEDGYFFSSTMRANRSKFASKGIMGGTMEEKALAVETFTSYCGRYEVQDNKITIHLEIGLFPNWVGGKQERFFEFEGDRLIISSPPMLIRGVKGRIYAIWERV